MILIVGLCPKHMTDQGKPWRHEKQIQRLESLGKIALIEKDNPDWREIMLDWDRSFLAEQFGEMGSPNSSSVDRGIILSAARRALFCRKNSKSKRSPPARARTWKAGSFGGAAQTVRPTAFVSRRFRERIEGPARERLSRPRQILAGGPNLWRAAVHALA